ncbi:MULTISPECIES: hypothetical protein [Shewanella]|jgi:hypothetical protein|uniref:Uncharacterized protein n=1 Tax=Shewanella indica TaxID=768528 RepID=A0ABU4Q965_9GAMM|nr:MULTISPECIES: hypothetical protein [Shewanella]MCE9790425.1 hypothetical protein [Shewanella indica]MDX6015952.1 hypothetical protein [Shewanella indica]NDO74943.1 hypothetical protein [Shewanella sp. SE1]
MDFRTYRELALTAEPGWGIAFLKQHKYEIYHQTLYWLMDAGLCISKDELHVEQLAGCDIIFCRLHPFRLERFLRSQDIPLYKSDSESRWVLPQPILPYHYRRWRASLIMTLG